MRNNSILNEMARKIHLSKELTINDEEQCTNHQQIWMRERASQAFYTHINYLAMSKQPVLLWKYRDTDATDVAQLIHQRSPFAKHQLATVSCRTNSLETWGKALAQLIDPHQPKTKVQCSCPKSNLPGGTLFLDDLEFLPKELQCLLYALLDQKGMIRFLGSNAQGVEVRVIASATVDIWSKSQEGLFRPNLFSQLNRLTVHCPSKFMHLPLSN